MSDGRSHWIWLCFAAGLFSILMGTIGCARSINTGTASELTDRASAHVHEFMLEGIDGESVNIDEDTIEVESKRPRTPEALTEAMDFRHQVISNIDSRGWRDPVTVFNDGYQPMLGSTHWVNQEFIDDGRIFDPTRPEFVMIVDDEIVGTMFLAADDDPEDPPGAPYVRWHFHTYNLDICFDNGVATGAPDADGACSNGGMASQKSPLMAHVWIVDINDPFTDEMDAYKPKQTSGPSRP